MRFVYDWGASFMAFTIIKPKPFVVYDPEAKKN